MGTVYRAVDETLDRDVAIKVLHPKLADARVLQRFRAEATTLARLNHPEIATIYELFQSENALLLVMELLRGETLESICSRVQALPPASAASLADKILSALDHAHRVGIVHCDIKPANVMVTDGGGIKIMDFGTARVRGPRAGARDRYTMGTPAYMSPEQVLGQDIDGRADLYAVGVVLYRLLTADVLPRDRQRVVAGSTSLKSPRRCTCTGKACRPGATPSFNARSRSRPPIAFKRPKSSATRFETRPA